ncbi:MAG: hypothetical protein IH623_11325 [Verrucomicrobia bacterium]|nr:hypothetical protein [Verrucomicrobiota bacterium]
MQKLLEIKDEAGKSALPGFRLKRLEMYNWGTFHEKVECLIPEGRWSLLVGGNGTGKSTAVDALRTLLVPPGSLTYNDATTGKKKDRTRKSYIRGTYGSESQEETATAQPKHLRPKDGTQSIILAVFRNYYTCADVTVAQIIWVQDEGIDGYYLVADGDKTIKANLTHLGSSREATKNLRNRGFLVQKSFESYSEIFRSKLGIPNRGAMEVFNQAIGVKEVTDLNLFIRKHMLGPSDAVGFLDTKLIPHYRELNRCWEAIQKAEAQLKRLKPIAEHYGKIVEAETTKKRLDALKADLPNYYATEELGLRVAYDEQLEEAISKLKQKREGLKTALDQELATKESIKIELSKDEVGSRLREIELEQQLATTRRDQKLQTLGGLKTHLTTLGKPAILETEAQFSDLRNKLLMEQGTLDGNKNAQEQKKVEHALAKEKAEQDRARIAAEAQSIRDNQVLIPVEFVTIRKAACEALGISVEQLPFAGELMEVKSEFKEWTGAIERLLHNFGVSLLVPENLYPQVARYINSKHLNIRFVFHRVPASKQSPRQEILNDPKRVPSRMNFKAHSLTDWVKFEIARRFSHICCADVQHLNAVDYGLTQEGLIREGSRHVKDDRFRVNDRAKYVLGWSTQSKLAALAEEFSAAEKRWNDAKKKFSQADEQAKLYGNRLSAVTAVLQITGFDQIDLKPEQELLARLHSEQQRLESSSDRVKELKKQLNAAEGRIEHKNQEIQDVDNQMGAQLDAQTKNRQRAKTLKEQLRGLTIDGARIKSELVEFQEEKRLTLESIARVENTATRKIQERVDEMTDKIDKAKTPAVSEMTSFLREYPEETSDLKPDIAYGPEFVSLKVRIEKDELPEQKARFAEFLNRNLIIDMASFATRLDEHDRNIQTSIEEVNRSLKNIDFSPGTFIEITRKPTSSHEVNSFRSDLRNCLRGAINPEKEDERIAVFQNIRKLICQFEKEKEWTARVTDARYWSEYGVRQARVADGKELNYFSGSGGRSGGQKSILAFMILASAFTTQYGLCGDQNDLNKFRLVVVDEVFSHTDEDNSIRALELFRKLDFQLIVVNPFDAKALLVQDYVDVFHLVNNSDEVSHLRRFPREDLDKVVKEGAKEPALA